MKIKTQVSKPFSIVSWKLNLFHELIPRQFKVVGSSSWARNHVTGNIYQQGATGRKITVLETIKTTKKLSKNISALDQRTEARPRPTGKSKTNSGQSRDSLTKKNHGLRLGKVHGDYFIYNNIIYCYWKFMPQVRLKWKSQLWYLLIKT